MNGQPSVKAPSDRAAYTGTIGGPMVIPKLLNWQRASFNVTYQGSSVPQREQFPGDRPDAGRAHGQFLRTCGHRINHRLGWPASFTIYDPLSGLPFPNNTIPLTRLDPIALGLLNYFPQPTYTLLAWCKTTGWSRPTRIIIRTWVCVSMPRSITRTGSPSTFNSKTAIRLKSSPLDSSTPTTGTGMSASVGFTHSFKPRLQNSLTFNLSRNNS